jgi:hypothetical protein
MTVCDHLVMTSFVNLIFLYVPHSELNRGVWDIALQKQRIFFGAIVKNVSAKFRPESDEKTPILMCSEQICTNCNKLDACVRKDCEGCRRET